ncbi:MAG: alpha/beta fold hydrolase, partial [Actinomycetota bacterium]
GRCTEHVVDSAIARLGPQPVATMTQSTTGSPLGATPSTYVVCAQDDAVHPDHQRVMADRCDHSVTIDTDHSPFVSAIAELADVVEAAARRGA